MENKFYARDVISTRDFTRDDLELLFYTTDKIRKMQDRASICKGKILCSLFFEPSTRTRLSFESAMISLGGSNIGFASPRVSSIEKGESMIDTIRVVDNYADVIVIRHRLMVQQG